MRGNTYSKKQSSEQISRKLSEFIKEIQYKNRNPVDNNVLKMLQEMETNPELLFDSQQYLYRSRIVHSKDKLNGEYPFFGFGKDGSFVAPSECTKDMRANYRYMHIRSDFRKWFPRMCQYGFIEGRDYEYMPRVRLQDEGGRTVQRYVKDYRITQDMAKKLCKLHHTAVGAAYHPQPFDWDALLGLLHKKPPRRSSYEAQLSDSDSLVTTTQIAKEYGCGAKVFNRLLHLHGIQYRANGQWVLYSEHHGKGYTSSLTFRLQRSDGSEVEKMHTAWTQKGRKFLYHTLKRRGVLPLAEQGG